MDDKKSIFYWIAHLLQKYRPRPKAYLSGILIVLKVDKGEAPGAPWLLVIDNIDVSQRAILWKHLPQIPLRSVQTQAEHTEAVVRIRVGLSKHRKTSDECELQVVVHSSISRLLSKLIHMLYAHLWQFLLHANVPAYVATMLMQVTN